MKKFFDNTKKIGINTIEKGKQNTVAFTRDAKKMLDNGYKEFKKFFGIKPKENKEKNNRREQASPVR